MHGSCSSRGCSWLVALSLAGCADDAPPGAEAGSSTTEAPPGSTGTPVDASTGAVDGVDTRTGGSTGTAGEGSDEGSSSGGSSSSEGGDSTTGEPSHADPRGYTLVAPLESRYTYLVDADGMEINAWESATTPANSAYMLPQGHMMRVARDPNATVELISGAGGIVQEFDWQGNVVWQYEHVGPTIVGHHDIAPMPNGHVLIVAYEMHTADEAIAAGRDPAGLSPEGLWSDFIVEVDPATDQIVWEWHVWDHLVQDFDPLASNYDAVGDRPERIDVNWDRPGTSPRPDWTHVNAVAYDEGLDQIVVSPRTFSEIWIVDHSTTTAEAAGSTGGSAGRGGDLLYRWGNPATYEAGDPVLDRQLWYQHDPHWLPAGKPGAGNILVFDNGDPELRPWSRVLEITTPVQADGTYPLDGLAYEPLEPVLVYEDPATFFAPFISGADRLTDGRTVICDGPTGRIFEVSEAGDLEWELLLGTSVFRAERYEADHPAWDGLGEEDLAPKGPLVVAFD